MILMQVIASSEATITRRIIMSGFTETDGSYIEYLSLTQVATVLDSLELQNMRS